ncbi:hypothetical protein C8J56DRAFT_902768 [Mycena floridula]|nr:hypothetical protein C8J56DRAFT_902768 [Mycena floridula]
MQALHAGLDLMDPEDSAVWCGACLAWRGCTHLGEILCKTHLSFNLKFNVRKTLSDWLTFTSSNDEFDVIWAFDNDFVPDDALLLAYKGSSGWRPLTHPQFMKRCNEVWDAAGMGTLLGHGLRIGGTTELLLAGTDPWVVMKQVGNRQTLEDSDCGCLGKSSSSRPFLQSCLPRKLVPIAFGTSSLYNRNREYCHKYVHSNSRS